MVILLSARVASPPTAELYKGRVEILRGAQHALGQCRPALLEILRGAQNDRGQGFVNALGKDYPERLKTIQGQAPVLPPTTDLMNIVLGQFYD
jgi:hypothetical protein